MLSAGSHAAARRRFAFYLLLRIAIKVECRKSIDFIDKVRDVEGTMFIELEFLRNCLRDGILDIP